MLPRFNREETLGWVLLEVGKHMTKRTSMKITAVLGGLLTTVAAASAATINHGPYSISLSSTNWTDALSVPLFDPALGTLTSIEFNLSGHVEGSALFESLDASPATVTMDLQAEIELQRPDFSTITTVIPVANTVDNVAAYDNVLDFGGTSGRTYADLTGDDSINFTSPPPLSDLALFTGIGTISLPITATGASAASGAGNLITQFSTSASAEASVTYIYEVIPEPASLSLLAIGGIAMLRRRR